MKSKFSLVSIVLVLAVFAIFGSTRTFKTNTVQTWEYKTVDCGLLYNDANKLGAEGWEMAVTIQPSTTCYVYFKRPKQ